MLQCYNRGCGKTYDPDTNSDDSCCHHPGAPYFHDVYKGWSCCKKKSVDFTEFLNIKGCTLSKHSNVKPPEPEKPRKEGKDNDDEAIVVQPIQESLERPPITTPMTVIKPVVDDLVKKTIDSIQSIEPTASENTSEGIPFGTTCQNHGCMFTYKGTNDDNSECQYHPGVPIFHEGMKFWSCCQKRTTDFAVFMAQKGCTYGEHKWIKEGDDKKKVECRHDWHQTASNVIVSIYAKKYHYAQSKIEVNPIRLHVNLAFPEQENATFNLDLELRGVIDVEKTSAHMYGTKVEITMRKAEPGSWAKLDFPNKKLPPVTAQTAKTNTAESKKLTDSDEDDDFNLDDIDTVTPGGLTLTEIKNDID